MAATIEDSSNIRNRIYHLKVDKDENDMKLYKIQRRIFIEKNEDFRRKVYTDTATSHNPTIGIGF